jgi:hypothetical protein
VAIEENLAQRRAEGLVVSKRAGDLYFPDESLPGDGEPDIDEVRLELCLYTAFRENPEAGPDSCDAPGS